MLVIISLDWHLLRDPEARHTDLMSAAAGSVAGHWRQAGSAAEATMNTPTGEGNGQRLRSPATRGGEASEELAHKGPLT
jgi:hypothetical protein